MIKQNKLTLKSMQSQIDSLLKQNQALTNEKNENIIVRLYKKLTSPAMLVFTTLIAYGHKIPFISKYITFLSIWFGRTSWWRILVRIRKAFVIFNAIIGAFTVYKLTGYSTDTFIGGISGMGYTYFEMITTTFYRIFTWFLELFDYKIIPNIPNNPPSPSAVETIIDKAYPFPRPELWSDRDWMAHINPRESRYPKPTPTWSLTDWVWYIGIGAVALGAAYLGFKFITGEQLADWIAPYPSRRAPVPPIDPNNLPTPNITLTDLRSDATDIPPRRQGVIPVIGNKLSEIGNGFVRSLNPLNYFQTTQEKHAVFTEFMDRQYDYVQANRKFYPFTDDNPHDSWFKKIKLVLYGEPENERLDRLAKLDYANRVHDQLKVNRLPRTPGTSTPYVEGSLLNANVGVSGHVSPLVSTQGLWSDIQQARINNTLSGATSKLKDYADTNVWTNHVRGPSIDIPNRASTNSNVLTALNESIGSSNIKGKGVDLDTSLNQIWRKESIVPSVTEVKTPSITQVIDNNITKSFSEVVRAPSTLTETTQSIKNASTLSKS